MVPVVGGRVGKAWAPRDWPSFPVGLHQPLSRAQQGAQSVGFKRGIQEMFQAPHLSVA